MSKEFNTSGDCKPELHYMVDISEKLYQIKRMVDAGKYFTINCARQYGKTTTLKALKRFLEKEYLVIRMDFQRLGYASFATEQIFVESFSKELLKYHKVLPAVIEKQFMSFISKETKESTLQDLFMVLGEWCQESEKRIVLMIDEVDSAANNQVFLDFLAQLRSYYLDRDEFPTFHSVILAGVYDVRNIKRKIRPEEEHKTNSPWNIAADFDVDMSFSEDEIASMLRVYEEDCHTGMNVENIAGLIYDYTSDYPYLVSRICKLMDEKVAGSDGFSNKAEVWTKQGFLEAVKILLSEKNTLFESLIGKMSDYPQMQQTLYSLLFGGETIVYNVFDEAMNIALLFGFAKKQGSSLEVANRIFEILLYNYFLTSVEAQNTSIFKAAANHKSQFIQNGRLDMDLVMKKFVEHFDSIYGDQAAEFDEEEGRRLFLKIWEKILS